ncbi:uncharacterized protein LOC124155034 [Ischnura elegans]|uniref:uncharacterized protein LOC124155034 n=1 Tax=Ischnura elegans TaxID=197161 RepID=UPI001ED8992E|nr:uncharacterized protein LOC124155034 [Ischnura elegans]
MSRNAIFLIAAALLLCVTVVSCKPLDEEILIERYFRSLREVSTEPGPLAVGDRMDKEPARDLEVWLEPVYVDDEGQAPALSLSYVDLMGLKPSVNENMVKDSGKLVESRESLRITSRFGGEMNDQPVAMANGGADAENKIPLHWNRAQGLFRQLQSS